MLNWFKKTINLFKRQNHRQKSPHRRQSTKQSDYQADEQATFDRRIHYEYPEGNFRFPLIPDEETFHRTDRNKRAERPAQQLERPKKQSQDGKAPSRKGPFRPTKLPPSFYGINKQTEHSEPIEYELSSFMSAQLQEQLTDHTSTEKQVVDSENIVTTKSEQFSKSIKEEGFQKEENLHQDEKVSTLNGYERIKNSSDQTNQQQHRKTDQQQDNKPVKKRWSREKVSRSKHETKGPAHYLAKAQQSKIPFNVMMLPEDKKRLAEQKLTEQTKDNSKQQTKVTQNPGNIKSVDQELNNNHKSKLAATTEERPQSKVMGKDEGAASTEITTEQQKVKEQNLITKGYQTAQQRDKSTSSCEQTHIETEQTNINSDQRTTLGEQTKNNDEQLDYELPHIKLLNPPEENTTDLDWINKQRELLTETLKNFRVGAKVVKVTQGPSVTRFELHPDKGVKVNKVTNLADDLKLSLAAHDIRIEAPIPGKRTIGIEIPNKASRPVYVSEIINNEVFTLDKSPLSVALGLDISGRPVVTDLRKMPHGLIAGATGSGKSVCINTMIISLLYRSTPEEVKLLLIDPKMVELAPYNGIPHLLSPVITDIKAATAALKWAVEEMERRYQLFAASGARDLNRYNYNLKKTGDKSNPLPYIVIIIDELADLMMMAPTEVEESICRIAQKARACGIHLIIATQRPSVDVITGLIKANIPTRIAFSVSSQADSRTIIDVGGAERLLGRGDMLFLENGAGKLARLQGTFVSDDEIDDVVAFVKQQREPNYLFEQDQLLKQAELDSEDELYEDVCRHIVEEGSVSTSSLQRQFRIGYNRAARLIDTLEDQGFITESRGSRPRDVLITQSDLEMFQ